MTKEPDAPVSFMSTDRNGNSDHFVWLGTYDDLMIPKIFAHFLPGSRTFTKIILEGYDVVFPSINGLEPMPFLT